jgi:hypothetical protein
MIGKKIIPTMNHTPNPDPNTPLPPSLAHQLRDSFK